MSARRLEIGILLFACALLTFRAWPTLYTVVDDAYISARYADHLAHGLGLTYSVGEPPIEGFTNFLWTTFLALGLVIGMPAVEVMVYSGLLFGWLSLAGCALLTRQMAPKAGLSSVMPAILLALSPHFAVATTNGLESSMFVAGVTLTLWATLAARGRSRLLSGLLAGCLGLIRPEGWAIGGLCLLYDSYQSIASKTRRERFYFAGPFAMVVFGMTIFRLAYYGDFVPNTFSAKADAPIEQILANNARYIWPDIYLWTWTGLLGVLGLVPSPNRGRRALALTAAVSLLAISYQVTLWMPGARLLLPSYTLLLCVAVSGANGVRTNGPVRLMLLALIMLPVSWFSVDATKRVRTYDGHHSVLPKNSAQLAAEHLKRHATEGSWLATRDAGVLAYYVGPSVRVAELHNRALTRPHRDGAAARVVEYTPENPEFIITTVARKTSREFRYANDKLIFQRKTVPYEYLGRVEQHFHRYYDIYVRADLNIPPLQGSIVENRNGENPKAPRARTSPTSRP